ncbi:tyrosine-type recombinase/integrase [Geothrix sp. SG200]|uniref:tyrosine-type recombinase/integrase n=1 Tax=Geothrix sp. SG200 TaxID=2922865 RepID=UPI001FACB8AE|nr:tyrosine-type recombinase/integrase [Geothrix sp. SG200]
MKKKAQEKTSQATPRVKPPDDHRLVEVNPEVPRKVRPDPDLVTPDLVVRMPAAKVPITRVISTTTSPAGIQVIPGATPVQMVIASFISGGLDSEDTRRAYRRHLHDAVAILGVEDVRDLTGARLAGYRARLLADGRGPATHAQALAAVRAFLRWVGGVFHLRQFDGEVLRATLRAPRVSVIKPYLVLTEAETARMIKAAADRRDRAIVMTLLGAGPRVSELTGLDVRDLRQDADGGDILHIRAGKGAKDRMVPIHEEVTRAIHAYLSSSGRTTTDSGPLFLAQDRGRHLRTQTRVGARAVRDLIYLLHDLAEIAKPISPHSLRHSFAIRALRYSGNILAVSKMLGHANVATTQTYLDHLGLGELRRAVPHLPVADGGRDEDGTAMTMLP